MQHFNQQSPGSASCLRRALQSSPGSRNAGRNPRYTFAAPCSWGVFFALFLVACGGSNPTAITTPGATMAPTTFPSPVAATAGIAATGTATRTATASLTGTTTGASTATRTGSATVAPSATAVRTATRTGGTVPAGTATRSATVGVATPAAGLGQPVQANDWEVTVLSWDNWGQRPLPWSAAGDVLQPEGGWAVVIVAMTNRAPQPRAIDPADFQLRDADGRVSAYPTQPGARALSVYRSGSLPGEPVAPGQTVYYYLPFDIAPQPAALFLVYRQGPQLIIRVYP